MYQKILVPLDGSKLAERVLPYLEDLASHYPDCEVTLVSVTERVQGYRPVRDISEPSGQRLLPEAVGKMDRQARRYLNRIAKSLKAKNIKVQTQILLGNPAEEITFFAKAQKSDLIIMASHGRTGASRWAFGSVADKVFRASHAPVLMVRSPEAMK